MSNGWIKVTSSNKKEKVYSWICTNEKPKCVSVSIKDGPEYLISLKSLLSALKSNKIIK